MFRRMRQQLQLGGAWWFRLFAVPLVSATVFTGPAGAATAPAAWASCPTPPPVTAAEVDRHLEMAALVQEELRAQGVRVALVSRSGLNLGRIGHRYSHAGFLRPLPLESGPSGTQDPSTVWAVRQLYYDCDTGQPRIFDEGLAGFVRGMAPDTWPRLSVVWWPDGVATAIHPPPARAVQGLADHRPTESSPHETPTALLARAVVDDSLALALLSPHYRAQAHAWSLVTQNCNQWLVEMLAAAFSGARDRATAQDWLRLQGYRASTVPLPWAGWLVAAALMPHMGLAHHPPEDLQALRFVVSLPAAIEGFVQRRWPEAQRVEWCLRGQEVVVRRSWEPLDDACTPGPGDERRRLMP